MVDKSCVEVSGRKESGIRVGMKAVNSCDTDLFLLNKVSHPFVDHCQYQIFQQILHDTLTEIVKNKGFDFELATLRLYNGGYLLFHAHVFGGAKETEQRVNHLIEAEKIASENLTRQLEKFDINSSIANKIFVCYSEDIDKLKSTIPKIFSDLRYREMEKDTIMYYSNGLLVIGTKEDRLIKHASLDYISFKVLEKIVEYDTSDSDIIFQIIERVITKFFKAGPIFHTINKKGYKKDIYISAFIYIIMIVLSTEIFLYDKYVFSNVFVATGFILLAISIIGMGVITLKTRLADKDVFFS